MRSSVCKIDAILICFAWWKGAFLVTVADAKAVLRLMMTDTAPQIEAVSEATSIPQTTDFHLGEIEPPPPACFLQEEDEEEGIWIWI